MYQTQPIGFTANGETWFLVANRGGAKILASDGGTRNLRLLEHIPHPEGRLKNREIDSDRASGSTMGAGGANFPVHGLANKNTATRHVMELFAGELAEMLHRGRAVNAFNKLVLVAEPRFLGELRSRLNESTQKTIDREIDKDIYNFDLDAIKEHLTANWLPD